MSRNGTIWLLRLAVLFVAGVVALWYYMRHKSAEGELRLAGRLLTDRTMFTVHWQGLETNEGFLKLVRHLDESLKRQPHSVRFISPDSTINAEQPNDQFERDLLARFVSADPAKAEDGKQYPFAERRSEDRTTYLYYQPIFAKTTCTSLCHTPNMTIAGDPNPPPTGRAAPGNGKWNEGDLMAVLEVAIPLPLDKR